MQALAASCEELRARTGKPPLRLEKSSSVHFAENEFSPFDKLSFILAYFSVKYMRFD
jgi:hypothetical protein